MKKVYLGDKERRMKLKRGFSRRVLPATMAATFALPVIASTHELMADEDSGRDNADNEGEVEASSESMSAQTLSKKDYSKIATPDKPDNEPTYLNNLTPTSQSIGGGKQLKNSERLDGGKLNLNIKGKNMVFDNGYMAHAPARLEFNISELSKTNNLLSTYIGIDPKLNGNVKYRFYLDGTLVYTSKNLDKKSGERVNLPLNGAKTLKIEIDDNGNVHQDHAVLADLKVLSINDLPSVPNLSEERKSLENKVNMSTVNSKDGRMSLYRMRFDTKSQNDLFSLLVENPKYRRLYDWIRSDYDALEMLASTASPAGGYANFFNVLDQIYSVDKSILKDNLNKKLALATALEFSRPVSFWASRNRVAEPVGRYQIYRDLSRTKGALLADLNTYDIEEMRAVVSAEVSNEDLLWIREKVKKEKPEFLTSPEKLASITYQYLRYNLYNKYGDSVQTSYFYGDNPDLARIIEYGGVCGAISKFDVVVLRAFGIPANVIGQPAHAAVTYLGTGKVWRGYNFVTGWDRSQGGVYSGFASTFERYKKYFKYNNSGYTTTYNQLTQDAKKNEVAYTEANLYYMLALETENESKKKEYLEKAIELNPLFLPAHDELIFSELQKSDSDLNEQALASYVARAFDNLKQHPKPVMDIAYAVKDKIKSRAFKVDFFAKLLAVEEEGQKDDAVRGNMAKQIVRTKEFQELIQDGKNLLGSFSFDGEHAERLWGAKTDTEYSLDGGKSWKPVLVANQLLTEDEIKQISAENGIMLRLKGISSSEESAKLDSVSSSGVGVMKLQIIQPEQPSLDVFSRERFITGLDESMEWSIDGTKWYPFDHVNTYLENSNKISVRHKRTGNKLESKARDFDFSGASRLEDIMHLNTEVISSSSKEDGYELKSANNGNYKNIFLSALNGSDEKPNIVFKFDQQYTVKGFRYVPRQDGKSVGNIVKAKIETSNDGSHWEEVETVTFNYNGNKRKVQNWTASNSKQKKAQHVRITVLESGKDKEDDFATVLGMADIMFQTTADEARKGQEAYLARTSAQNLNELKKGIDSFYESGAAVRKTMEELKKSLEEKKSSSTYSSEKISEIESLLNELSRKLDEFDGKKSERTSIEENNDNRSKLQDTFISSRQESLSLAATARLAEAKILYLDVKDNENDESAAELKKIETEAETLAAAFKEKYKDLLAKIDGLKTGEAEGETYDLSSLSDEEKAKAESAYYELKSLPVRAKLKLKSAEAAFAKVTEKNKFDREEKEVADFRKDFADLLALKPEDLSKSNYKRFREELREAKVRFNAIDETTRKSLNDEAWHLFYPTMVAPGKRQEPMQTYIAKFEAEEANQALRRKYNSINAYRRSMSTSSDKLTQLKEELRQALLEAKNVATNKNASSEENYAASQKLELKFNDVKREIIQENDRIDRINQFRTQYSALVNKDLKDVTADDKKKAEAALKVFNRLTDAAKAGLTAEKQAIDSIIATASISASEKENNLTYLKEKLKLARSRRSLVEEELPANFSEKIAKAYEAAVEPSDETAESYKSAISALENAVATLKEEAKSYQEKVLAYRTSNSEILSQRLSDFSLNDEAKLKKAEDELKNLENELQTSVPEIRKNLLAKQAKLAELKARAYEADKSESEYQKALEAEEKKQLDSQDSNVESGNSEENSELAKDEQTGTELDKSSESSGSEVQNEVESGTLTETTSETEGESEVKTGEESEVEAGVGVEAETKEEAESKENESEEAEVKNENGEEASTEQGSDLVTATEENDESTKIEDSSDNREDKEHSDELSEDLVSNDSTADDTAINSDDSNSVEESKDSEKLEATDENENSIEDLSKQDLEETEGTEDAEDSVNESTEFIETSEEEASELETDNEVSLETGKAFEDELEDVEIGEAIIEELDKLEEVDSSETDYVYVVDNISGDELITVDNVDEIVDSALVDENIENAISNDINMDEATLDEEIIATADLDYLETESEAYITETESASSTIYTTVSSLPIQTSREISLPELSAKHDSTLLEVLHRELVKLFNTDDNTLKLREEDKKLLSADKNESGEDMLRKIRIIEVVAAILSVLGVSVPNIFITRKR